MVWSLGSHWAAQPSVFPPSRGKGHFPRRAGPSGVAPPPPAPPRPETRHRSRWLEDFSSHATLSGVGEGGWAEGFLRSQAWSPWGPARMWAPTLAGQGEPAAAPCVPREAWEGGSLCPAHRELTHRAPKAGCREGGLALGGCGGWGLKMRSGEVDTSGSLARNLSFKSWHSGVISQEGSREDDECGQRHRSGWA